MVVIPHLMANDLAAQLTNARSAQEAGDYRKAREFFEQAYDIARQKQSGGLTSEVQCMLGGVALLANDPAAAARHIDDALPALRTAFGPRDIRVAYCLHYKGKLEQYEERMSAALSAHSEALDIARGAGNAEPHLLGKLHLNRAQVQFELGSDELAEKDCQQALALLRTAPNGRSDFAFAYSVLSSIRRSQGKFGEAAMAARTALRTYEKAVGPKHPQIVLALAQLGELEAELHLKEEAEKHLKRALFIAQEVLPENGVETHRVYNGLGFLYLSSNRSGDAIRVFERLASLLEGQGANREIGLAATRANLGLAYSQRGDFHKALLVQHQALATMEARRPVGHMDIGLTWMQIATTHRLARQWLDAEQAYRKGFAILDASHGKVNPALAADNMFFAQVLKKLGKREEASVYAARGAQAQQAEDLSIIRGTVDASSLRRDTTAKPRR